VERRRLAGLARAARAGVALVCLLAVSCGTSPRAPERALEDALGRSRDALAPWRGREDALHATQIEDPSGHALDHVRTALARAARGEGAAHVVVYGGSHTAADLYTGVLRHALQEGFGDLGHGFVMPVPPFESYWQAGVRVFPSEGFAAREPSLKHMEPDTYGLAGMAFDAEGGAIAELATDRTHASRIELFFLARPGGGTVRVSIDGCAMEVSTESDTERAASATFATFDGEHRITLEALGDGPVRLYGVALGREGPGVVLDQLGLAGAKARHQLLWNEEVWAALLASRRPDLFIVSYGNNETDDQHLADEAHVAHFDAMLSRLRRRFPEASCLVLGPADRLLADAGGALSSPHLLEVLRDTERASARREGCAFYDVMGWQGGPGAMRRLRRTAPPLAREDAIHFTELGYRRLGAAIGDALLDALEAPRSAL
jgi:lysophospholipase L1-like esterase